jgi:thioredoxin-dependent peroxiredoxin
MSMVNKKAPHFSLPCSNGEIIDLTKFLGKKLLLIFYPGDETMVCTKQLCEYNLGIDKFLELNVQLLGISKDSIDSHASFSRKYNFSFPLLSDTSGKVCKDYGVLGILGVKRSIFLIDEFGIIKYENTILPIFYQDINKLINEVKSISNN